MGNTETKTNFIALQQENSFQTHGMFHCGMKSLMYHHDSN